MSEGDDLSATVSAIGQLAERELGPETIAVFIISRGTKISGQRILVDSKHDKKTIAARLRLCADYLDPPH